MASGGMAQPTAEKGDRDSMFVDKLPEEINEMKIRDEKVEKEMEATVVDGNGTETGHIIVTTIGGRNGQPKQRKKKLRNEGKDGSFVKEEGLNADSAEATDIEEEQGGCKYSARFEAERVWLELYKVDHLGFGRVSFNGIQSLG
ncbi:hypothetical protein QVD17_36635 [Tagetes erecta]|uniref:Uncharacterized protein n=1 Tax=Tagetes erecta TaxID=13708 RepID=A0AAD8NID9_TARER|nr:hypothetical protein QVD17_36635 [Tagetes erecta]